MPKAQHSQRYLFLPPMLRAMRQEAGLTQRDLGTRLGTSHVFVHKSEIGERRVDVTEFLDWCRACSVDPLAAFQRLIKLRR
jgi:transcriptional regulator with XRE-family HTH domain